MRHRILILTEIIAPYRIPEFNALAARDDVDLHVVFLSETDMTLRDWRVYRDELRFSHQVLPHWRRRSNGTMLLLNRGVWAALKGWRPDVIACGGYNYPASWQALLWARARRVPFLLWCESNLNDRRSAHPGVESAKRIFFKACNGFIVPGKASTAYLRAFGIPEGRIGVAPNAVDNDLFARKAAAARGDAAAFRRRLGLPDRFFLYVGRLVREKGVFDLLEAYACLEPGLRAEVGLVLAGDGAARSELLERAASISPGRVHWAGFVQRDDLPACYALAEALVFPTWSDPWGFVVNEAMACGLPVIASSVAGCVPDMVEDGWNGYVVPPGGIEKLASAMAEIAGKPYVRQAMGERSADRIRRFSPEACAAGFAAAAARTRALR